VQIVRYAGLSGARVASLTGDIAREHGGFGAFLAAWPAEDQVGLMALLAARGARLGGATGQYFLRFVGFDLRPTFIGHLALQSKRVAKRIARELSAG